MSPESIPENQMTRANVVIRYEDSVLPSDGEDQRRCLDDLAKETGSLLVHKLLTRPIYEYEKEIGLQFVCSGVDDEGYCGLRLYLSDTDGDRIMYLTARGLAED